MPPSVALTHPNDFSGVTKIIHECAARVVDKGVALLVYDRPGHARLRVYSNNPQNLVAALVIEKTELRRVGVPSDMVIVPRRWIKLIGNWYLPPRVHCKEMRDG